MSTLKITTLSNFGGTKSVPVDTVVDGSAKAWVNFNGTGTVAIRASFNVTSITDNNTGDFTVNITNALTDANYSIAGSVQSNGSVIDLWCIKDGTTPTSSAFTVFNAGATTGTGRDPLRMCLAAYR